MRASTVLCFFVLAVAVSVTLGISIAALVLQLDQMGCRP